MRPPPTQRPRDRQVRGDKRRALHLGNYLPKNVHIEEGICRSGSDSEGFALSLRHRDGSVREEALTAFRPQKSCTSRGRPSLLGKGRRGGGQGCVEERWVGWLKPVTFQHGQNSGHQPETRTSSPAETGIIAPTIPSPKR